jgi:hypothetical protein
MRCSRGQNQDQRQRTGVSVPHLRFSVVPGGTWFLVPLVTHGLRHGLRSVAALRLGFGGLFCALLFTILGAAFSGAEARIYFVTLRGAEAPLFHGCAGVRGGTRIPTSRKGREKWGTQVRVKRQHQRQRQRTEVSAPHGQGQKQDQLQERRCRRPSVPPLRQAQGRLLRKERARMGHPQRFLGREVKVKIKVKIEVKINVNGSGRGRPFYIYWACM